MSDPPTILGLPLEDMILPIAAGATVLVAFILVAVHYWTKESSSLPMNQPGFNNQPMTNYGNGEGYPQPNQNGGFWGNARHSFRAVAMAPWSMWNNSPNQNNFQGQPMNNGDGQMNGNRSGPGFWGNARNSFRAPWSRRNNAPSQFSSNEPNQNDYQGHSMNGTNEMMGNGPNRSGQGFWGNARNSLRVPWSRRNNNAAGFSSNEPNEFSNQGPPPNNNNGQMGNGANRPPQGFWGNARNSFRAPWSRRNNNVAGFPPNQHNESANQNHYEGPPASNTNGSMGNAPNNANW